MSEVLDFFLRVGVAAQAVESGKRQQAACPYPLGHHALRQQETRLLRGDTHIEEAVVNNLRALHEGGVGFS